MTFGLECFPHLPLLLLVQQRDVVVLLVPVDVEPIAICTRSTVLAPKSTPLDQPLACSFVERITVGYYPQSSPRSPIGHGDVGSWSALPLGSRHVPRRPRGLVG